MRKLVYVVLVLLLSGCVPIGVRVQNMLAVWMDDRRVGPFLSGPTRCHWIESGGGYVAVKLTLARTGSNPFCRTVTVAHPVS